MNNNQKLLDVLRAMKYSADHYFLIGNKNFHDSHKVKNKTIMDEIYVKSTLKTYFIDSFSKQNNAHEYIENAIRYKKGFLNKALKASCFCIFFVFCAFSGAVIGELVVRTLLTLIRGDEFALKNFFYIVPILIMFYMICNIKYLTEFNFYKFKHYKKQTQKYKENFKNVIKTLLSDIEVYKINSDISQDKNLIEEAEYLESYIIELQNDEKKINLLFNEISTEINKEIDYNYFNSALSSIQNTLKDKKLGK